MMEVKDIKVFLRIVLEFILGSRFLSIFIGEKVVFGFFMVLVDILILFMLGGFIVLKRLSYG